MTRRISRVLLNNIDLMILHFFLFFFHFFIKKREILEIETPSLRRKKMCKEAKLIDGFDINTSV